MGKGADAWIECATIVDTTKSWQVLAGSAHYKVDSYVLDVVSKGPIPRLPEGAFGDIADSVDIGVDPDDDSHTTTHVLKYLGGLAGMQMFAETLATTLDHGAEGDVNPISDFVSRNPFWLLQVVTRSN